jgi:hypothetical protein
MVVSGLERTAARAHNPATAPKKFFIGLFLPVMLYDAEMKIQRFHRKANLQNGKEKREHQQ